MEITYSEEELQKRLELLKRPFEADQMEKLPKYCGKKDANGRVPKSAYGNCPECGKRHPLPSVHLDYVGHAGITDRLNEVDPFWHIEPMAYNASGLPCFDGNGGLWCWITILGIKRMCYGDSQGKTGPNAVKEAIGDAIRNGAMRFGVATYLWSKSERAEAMKPGQEEPPARAEKPSKAAIDPALEDARKVLKDALVGFCGRRGGSPEGVWSTEVEKAKAEGRAQDPAFWLERADMYRAMP